ncbi:MAG: hypothetical protein HY841_03570 [Bacteroidetes bacterium]|nr:hypothetical protein [Bacteroidota bacterium]
MKKRKPLPTQIIYIKGKLSKAEAVLKERVLAVAEKEKKKRERQKKKREKSQVPSPKSQVPRKKKG